MTTAMPPPMQLICATASLARQAALHRDRVRLEPAPCPSASPTPCHVPFTNHTVHCTVDRPRPCPDHLHSVGKPFLAELSLLGTIDDIDRFAAVSTKRQSCSSPHSASLRAHSSGTSMCPCSGTVTSVSDQQGHAVGPYRQAPLPHRSSPAM